MESISFQTFGLNINLPNKHRTAEFLIYYLAVSPVLDRVGRIRCNKCPGLEFYCQHYNNCGMYCIFTWLPHIYFFFLYQTRKTENFLPTSISIQNYCQTRQLDCFFLSPRSSNKKRSSEHDFHFTGRFCGQISKLRASFMENQSERQWCDWSLGTLCNRRSLHHD